MAPALLGQDALDRAQQDAARRLLGVETPRDALARDRLLASRFFLVRNDGGERRERIACDRCGALHEFISWCCLPRPFVGLSAALRVVATVRAADAPAAARGLENLARTHPRSFGERAPSRGEDWLAFAVGTVEPITQAQAARLTFAVQCRDRAFDPTQ